MQPAEYVLFIKPGDANSKLATDLAAPLYGRIHIQDVTHIQRHERPPCLQGVPTLIEVNAGRALSGGACLGRLRQLGESSPSHVPSRRLERTDANHIPMTPYVSEAASGIEPLGLDGSAAGAYAPCDYQVHGEDMYTGAKRTSDQLREITSRLTESRETTLPKEPTAAERDAVLRSMQEPA